MDHFHSPCHNHIYVSLQDPTRHEPGPNNDVPSQEIVDSNRFSLLHRYPGRADESIGGTDPWTRFDNAQVHSILNTTKKQDDLTEHDQYSGSGIYVYDQPWPAIDSWDVDSAVLNQFARPSNAKEMNGSTSMSCWTPNEYNFRQSFSPHLTPELFQDAPSMIQDNSLPTFNIRPSTLQRLGHRFAGNLVYTEQGQGQASTAVVEMIDKEDAATRIGSVLNNGRFMCNDERCAGSTFARQAELKRHYTTLHAINKPNFWCPILTCRRSISGGGKAFYRKDKLMAHIRSMHPNVQRVYSP